MKSTRKKIVGGFLVAILVATIGAVIVSAQTEDTSMEDLSTGTFWHRGRRCGEAPFMAELTVEQREELEVLITSLQDDDATPEEIKTVVQEKLKEFGIEVPTIDERLDMKIEKTEQRLEILNRQKELLEQGYTMEEIRDIIQEEYELEEMFGEGQGMMSRRGFKRGHCNGSFGSN